MTSYVLRHERCPECAKTGKDKHGDNLGVYSDGHKYCFSCGYMVQSNGLARLQPVPEKPKKPVYVPPDCILVYPDRVLNWVKVYGLSEADLLQNTVMWSESCQRLIFPVFDDGEEILAWQGRDFKEPKDPERSKWFGVGALNEVFNFIGEGNTLVLVEDVVSAIKVSKAKAMAMPLYGSHIGPKRLRRLYNLFGQETEVVIWLDRDKSTVGSSEARLGRLFGLTTRTVVTERDPKDETLDKIKDIIYNI